MNSKEQWRLRVGNIYQEGNIQLLRGVLSRLLRIPLFRGGFIERNQKVDIRHDQPIRLQVQTLSIDPVGKQVV